MATTPSSTSPAAQGFKPAFKRVQQTPGCGCDSALACIAMIAGKTLDEVRQIAIDQFKHPRNGPFWITEDLIYKLLLHFGWVATVYKESTGITSLPDLAIGMVEYNTETELGRHVLFHRMAPAGSPKQTTEYIIDPAYWIPPSHHVRTEIKGFPIAWYIGVHPVNKPPVKASQ